MIDKEKFSATKEMMGDAFGEFLEIFFTELEGDVKSILNTSDNEIIHLKAHSQKSSCALLGAATLKDMFEKIEERAKTNQEVKDLKSQLPELLTQTRHLLQNT